MITTVYFIRHAEPDFEVKEDEVRPLTNKGLKDANRLIDFFSDVEIDKVFSSPYKRAYDTVYPLAIKRNLKIEIVDDFRERKVSDGTWIEDFTGFAKNQWSNFEYNLSGGECLKTVQKRNIEALNDILERGEGLNIVVGSHGTALSTIINHYDESFGYEDFIRIKNIMPWIVKFTFVDGKKPEIESFENT